MARIARVVAPGRPHHITQRGNRRQATFFGTWESPWSSAAAHVAGEDDALVTVAPLRAMVGAWDQPGFFTAKLAKSAKGDEIEGFVLGDGPELCWRPRGTCCETP